MWPSVEAVLPWRDGAEFCQSPDGECGPWSQQPQYRPLVISEIELSRPRGRRVAGALIDWVIRQIAGGGGVYWMGAGRPHPCSRGTSDMSQKLSGLSIPSRKVGDGLPAPAYAPRGASALAGQPGQTPSSGCQPRAGRSRGQRPNPRAVELAGEAPVGLGAASASDSGGLRRFRLHEPTRSSTPAYSVSPSRPSRSSAPRWQLETWGRGPGVPSPPFRAFPSGSASATADSLVGFVSRGNESHQRL